MAVAVTALPPLEPMFATLRELLAAVDLDCDSEDEVGSGVEEYAVGYLDEDLGMNLFVNLGEGDDGEGMSLHAKMSFYTDGAVEMWTLDAPFTISRFDRYLDELDLRVARLRTIIELPTTVEVIDGDAEDRVSIVVGLAALFDTDEADVVSRLGDDWLPIESAVVGDFGAPVRYLLWGGRLIVGLDDEYAHLFVPVRVDGEVQVGAVIASFELGENETIAFTQFAGALLSS